MALLNFPSKAQKGVSTVLGGAFRLAQQLVVERALRADATASGNFRPLTWWQGLASSEARSLWQNTSPSPRHKLSNPAWQTYARLAVGLPLLNLPGGQAVCPACGQTVFPDLLHALSCIRNRAQLTSRHTMVQTALLRALNNTRACANRAEVSVDCLHPRTAGMAPCIADIVSTPHNAADGAATARRRKLPISQHPYRGTLSIELTITNPGLKHARAQVRGAARDGEKRTKYLRAYAAIDEENLLVICFETSGNLTTTAFSGIVRLANAAIDRNGRPGPASALADIFLSSAAALQRAQMEMLINYASVMRLDGNTTCRRCLKSTAACVAARSRPGHKLCQGEYKGQILPDYDSDVDEKPDAPPIA